MKELPHIDVVVPIVRRDFVLPMLHSLHACTPSSHTVIVVDQTQPDWEFASQLWDLADIIIKPHKNYGFSQSVNIGLRIAPADYVVVANDDIEFIPGHDWLRGVMDTFERFPKAAAVNPQSPKSPGWGWAEPGFRYKVPEGWPDPELRRLGEQARETQKAFREVRLEAHHLKQDGKDASEQESQMRTLRRELLAQRERLAPLVYETVMNDPSYVEMLGEESNWAVIDGFPCWLPVFKRERLEEVGLFDERFSGGGEDYDETARAYKAGYRMLATSKAWAWHHWGKSKDASDGLANALPRARPYWNDMDSLWDPKLTDVWGRNCTRIDSEPWRAPL